MIGQPGSLKVLIIYLICIPLALFLGMQVSDLSWWSEGSIRKVGIVAGVLMIPIFLKWHRPLLFFTLNASLILYFAPGKPNIGLVLVAISLLISVLQRILQPRSTFLTAPEIARPMIAVIAVLCFTAFLRGGVGFSAFGGSNVGGSRYMLLLLGALSYFAMTAEGIPEKKRLLYLGLFFLSGVTSLLGDFFYWVSQHVPSLIYLYLLFPARTVSTTSEFEFGETRLLGVTAMAASIYHYMLARYGVRTLLTDSNKLKLLVFLGVCVLAFFGGFRSAIIHFALLFFVMFYLERLYRTGLVIPIILAGVLFMTVGVAFLPKMPFVFQRALAFLPIQIAPEAQISADSSSEWRRAMWQSVLPEVPNHLFLGKGLGFTEAEFEAIKDTSLNRNPDQWTWAVITGDYHNGILSIILTFGIWGLIAYVWLHIAGWRALVANFRYGDPALKVLNAFLLCKFVVHLITFWFVSGSMYSDTVIFATLLGFSVCLNGGICRVPQQVLEPLKLTPPSPQPHAAGPGPKPQHARVTPTAP